MIHISAVGHWPLHLGEEGTEQFTIRTYANEEKIGDQKIHDPFIRTTVKLKGLKWAWKAIFGGIEVRVCVDGSEGASRAIMTLNPVELKKESDKILEERKSSHASIACFSVDNNSCPPSLKK